MKAVKSSLAGFILFVLAASGSFLTCEIGLGNSVDTKPPTVSITYPPFASVIKGSFVLAGTGNDETSLASVTASLIDSSGDKVGSFGATVDAAAHTWRVNVSNDRTWDDATGEYTTANYPDGKYIVRVQAKDSAGRTSTVEGSYFLDNTAPIVRMSSPSTTGNGSIAGGTLYGQEVVFKGDLWDAGYGGEICSRVVFSFYDADWNDLYDFQVDNPGPSLNETLDLMDASAAALVAGMAPPSAETEREFAYTVTAYDYARTYLDPSDRTGVDSGNKSLHYFYRSNLNTLFFSSPYLPKLQELSAWDNDPDAATLAAVDRASFVAGRIPAVAAAAGSGEDQGPYGNLSIAPYDNAPTVSIGGLDPYATYSANSIASLSNLTIKITQGLDENITLDTSSFQVRLSSESDYAASNFGAWASITNFQSVGDGYLLNHTITESSGNFVFEVYALDSSGQEAKNRVWYINVNDGAPTLDSVTPQNLVSAYDPVKVRPDGSDQFTVTAVGRDTEPLTLSVYDYDVDGNISATPLATYSSPTVTAGGAGERDTSAWTIAFDAPADGDSVKLAFRLNDGRYDSGTVVRTFLTDTTGPDLHYAVAAGSVLDLGALATDRQVYSYETVVEVSGYSDADIAYARFAFSDSSASVGTPSWTEVSVVSAAETDPAGTGLTGTYRKFVARPILDSAEGVYYLWYALADDALDENGDPVFGTPELLCVVGYDKSAPTFGTTTLTFADASTATVSDTVVGKTSQLYTIDGTATDTNGIASVAITRNGTLLDAADVSVSYGANTATWSYDELEDTDQTNTYLITATDKAGKTTTITRTVIYDTAGPSLTVNNLADGAAIPSASYDVAGTAVDTNGIASVTYSLNAGAWTSVSTPGVSWKQALSGLTEGSAQTIQFRAADAIGNETTGDLLHFGLDLSNPALTVTNYAAVNGTTRNANFDLNGTTSDNNGIKALEYSVDAGSTWTDIAATGLPSTDATEISWTQTVLVAADGADDGLKSIRVRATDQYDKQTTSVLSVRYDSAAPTFSVNNLVDGQLVTAASFAVNGSWTDNGGSGTTGGSATVEWSLDDSSWTAFTTVTASTWSGSVGLGAQSLAKDFYVRATDNAGNVSDSTHLVIKVDTAAPTITETSITDENLVYRKAGVALALTGDVTDTLGLDDGRVEITAKKNGVSQGVVYTDDTIAGASDTWSYGLASGNDGLWLFTIVAYDSAGQASASVTRLVRMDSTLPLASITAPASDGAIIGGVSYTFSGAASDVSGSGVASVEYSFDNFATAYTASGTESWNAIVAPLDTVLGTEGPKTLYVRSADAAGNPSVTASRPFVYDTAAPVLSVTQASTIERNAEFSLDGSVADNYGYKSLTVTQAKDGGSAVTVSDTGLTVVGTAPNATWTLANLPRDPASPGTTLLDDGVYVYTLTATDLADKPSAVATVTVTIDRTAPETLTVTSPSVSPIPPTGQNAISGSAYTFRGTVDDSGVGVQTVYWRIDQSSALATGTAGYAAISTGGPSWSFTDDLDTDGAGADTGRAQGTWYLHVKAGDKSGNVTADADEVIVSFDIDQGPPSLTETTLGVTTAVKKSGDFTLHGEASDTYGLALNGSSEEIVNVSYTGPSTGSVDVVVVSGEWTYNFPVSDTGSDDGTYEFTVTATDLVGKATTLVRTVVVDATAPVISDDGITAGMGASGDVNGTITFRFAASDAGVGLERSGTSYQAWWTVMDHGIDPAADVSTWTGVTSTNSSFTFTYGTTATTLGTKDLWIAVRDSVTGAANVATAEYDLSIDQESDRPAITLENMDELAATNSLNGFGQNPTILLTIEDDDKVDVSQIEYRIDIDNDGNFSSTLDFWDGTAGSTTPDGDVTDKWEDESVWYALDAADIPSADAALAQAKIRLTNFPQGNFRIQVRARDNVDASAWSAIYGVSANYSWDETAAARFAVDFGPPSISINTLASSVVNADFPFSGTASDALGVISVDYTVDGGATYVNVFTGSSTSVTINSSVDVDILPSGDYVLQVEATDFGGTTATQQIPFTVDRTAPTVTVLQPSSGATLNGAGVTVRGEANDNRQMGAIFLAQGLKADLDAIPPALPSRVSAGVYDAGGYVQVGTGYNWTTSIDTTAIASSGANGYAIRVVAVDSIGNVGIPVDHLVTVDQSYDRPTFGFSNLVTNGPPHSRLPLGNLLVVGTATDDDSVDYNYIQIRLDRNGDGDFADAGEGWVDVSQAPSANAQVVSWSHTISDLFSEGTRQIQLRALDVNAGAANRAVFSADATTMAAGEWYTILDAGDTDFTLYGATGNAAGTFFQATGAGTGTGTVSAPSSLLTGYTWSESQAVNFVIDNGPPALEVTAPTLGQRSTTGGFSVTGTTSDSAGIHRVVIWVDDDMDGVQDPVELTILGWNDLDSDGVVDAGEGSPLTTDTTVYDINQSISGLTNGAKTVRVSTYDSADAVTVREMTVIIDQTAPSASITAPTASSTLNGEIQVVGTASDNYDVAQVYYRFATGAGTFPDDYTLLAGTYAWNFKLKTTDYPDGAYTLRVVAVDGSGNDNSASPAAIAVTVNQATDRPVIDVTTLEEGNAAVENLLSSSLTVSGTVSDDDSVNHSAVQIRSRPLPSGSWGAWNSVSVPPSVDTALAIWSHAFTGFTDGQYEFEVRAADTNDAGAWAAAANSWAYQSEKAVTVSSGTFTSAAHGYSDGDTVLFRAGTMPSNLAEDTVYYVINAATDTFEISDSAGGAALSPAPDGGSAVYVRHPVQFAVDLNLPVGSIASPAPSSYYNADLDIAGTASDANGIKKVTIAFNLGSAYDPEITMYEDGDPSDGYVGTAASPLAWALSDPAFYNALFDVSAAGDGQVFFRVTITDAFDKQRTYEQYFTIDTAGPTVTITSVSDNPNTATGAYNGQIAFTGEAEDTLAVQAVYYRWGTAAAAQPNGDFTGWTAATSVYNWTASWNTLLDLTDEADHGYHLSAVAVDRVGNESAVADLPFVINQGSDRPTLSISSPTASQVLRGSATAYGSVSDDDGLASISIRIDRNNDGDFDDAGEAYVPVSSPATVSGRNTSLQHDLSSLSDGYYRMQVRVRDTGFVDSATTPYREFESAAVSFSIDTLPPSIDLTEILVQDRYGGADTSVTADFNGTYVNNDFTLTFVATDLNGLHATTPVEVSLDNSTWTAADPAGTDTYSADLAISSFANGTRLVYYRATDVNGGRTTGLLTLIVDKTDPTVSFTSPSGISTTQAAEAPNVNGTAVTVTGSIGDTSVIDSLSITGGVNDDITFSNTTGNNLSWSVTFDATAYDDTDFARDTGDANLDGTLDAGETWTNVWRLPITITAYDHAGNRVISTGYVDLDPDGDKPIVSISNPQAGSSVTGIITLMGTVVDDDGTSGTAAIELDTDNDGSYETSLPTVTVANGAWNTQINTATDSYYPLAGTVSFRVTPTDANGKAGDPMTRTFFVDRSLPQIVGPGGSSAPTPATGSRESGTITVSAQFRDDDVLPQANMQASLDGGNTYVAISSITGYSISADLGFSGTFAHSYNVSFPVNTATYFADDSGTGSMSVILQVTDNTYKPAVSSLTYAVDNRPPEAEWDPSATLTPPQAGVYSFYGTGSTNYNKVIGTAADGGSVSGIDYVDVYFVKGGTVFRDPKSLSGSAAVTNATAADKLYARIAFANAGTDTFTVDRSGWGTVNNALPVRFIGSSLPGGLDEDTLYYVQGASGNDFTLSTDPAGSSPVAITSSGSGYLEYSIYGAGVPYTVDAYTDSSASGHYAIRIDTRTELGANDANSNGDGDGFQESLKDKGGYDEWFAYFDTTALPDGPITVYYVAHDENDNKYIGRTSGQITNNPPSVTQVTVNGSVLDASPWKVKTAGDTFDVNVSATDTGSGASIAAAGWKLEVINRWGNGTDIAVSAESGFTGWEYGSDAGAVRDFSVRGSGSSFPVTATVTLDFDTDGTGTSDTGDGFEEGYWYELRATTVDADDNIATQIFYMKAQNNDTNAPTVTIDPINQDSVSMWTSKITPLSLNIAAANLTSGSSTISVGLPSWITSGTKVMFAGENVPGGFSRNTVYYVRDMVSGTSFALAASYGGTAISVSGTPTGTYRLASGGHVEASGDSAYSKTTADADVSGTIRLTGTVFDDTDVSSLAISINGSVVATLTPTLGLTGKTGDVINGWTYDWAYVWDTSTITEVAKRDVSIVLTAADASTYSADGTASTQADVVPYITTILDANGLSADVLRGATGKYSIASSASNVLTVRGYNLGAAATYTPTAYNSATAYDTAWTANREANWATGTSGTATMGNSGYPGNWVTVSKNWARSGWLTIVVNGVPSVNNLDVNSNSNNVESGADPRTAQWTDDRYLWVWAETQVKITDLSGSTPSDMTYNNANMLMNGDQPEFSWNDENQGNTNYSVSDSVAHIRTGFRLTRPAGFAYATVSGTLQRFIATSFDSTWNTTGDNTGYLEVTGFADQDANGIYSAQSPSVLTQALRWPTVQGIDYYAPGDTTIGVYRSVNRFPHPKLLAETSTVAGSANIFLGYFDANNYHRSLNFVSFRMNGSGTTNNNLSRATAGYMKSTDVIEIPGTKGNSSEFFDMARMGATGIAVAYYDETSLNLKLASSTDAFNITGVAATEGKSNSSIPEVTYITITNTTRANYAGKYFTVYNVGSAYSLWYDTTGSDAVPAGVSGTVIRLDISGYTGDGTNTMRNNIRNGTLSALQTSASAAFSATGTNPIIITALTGGASADIVQNLTTGTAVGTATVNTQGVDGAAWSTITVDSGTDVGQYVSMVSSGTKLYIAYYDFDNANLKMARVSWNGGAPTVDGIVSVDNYLSAGSWTNVTLMNNPALTGISSAQPVIAYYSDSYNGTKKSIRYAFPLFDATSGTMSDGTLNSGADDEYSGSWEVVAIPAITVPQGGAKTFNRVQLGLYDSATLPVVGWQGSYLEYAKLLPND